MTTIDLQMHSNDWNTYVFSAEKDSYDLLYWINNDKRFEILDSDEENIERITDEFDEILTLN